MILSAELLVEFSTTWWILELERKWRCCKGPGSK